MMVLSGRLVADLPASSVSFGVSEHVVQYKRIDSGPLEVEISKINARL